MSSTIALLPHVTFIHGISNKPPLNDLLRIWRDALADASSPLPLGDLGVSSTMVYWADLMYEAPDENLTAYEGVTESTPEAIDGAGNATPPQPRTDEEARFIVGLRATFAAPRTGRACMSSPSRVQLRLIIYKRI